MNNFCVFCKIIQKEIPANIVYETEQIISFLDILPINKGHLLIIPKRHSIRIRELTLEESGEIFKAARKIIPSMEKILKIEGTNFHLSDGKIAGQEIEHVHLHLIPRYPQDGQALGFTRSSEKFTQTDLKAIALDLKNAL